MGQPQSSILVHSNGSAFLLFVANVLRTPQKQYVRIEVVLGDTGELTHFVVKIATKIFTKII
jgi:hypothetical protein